MTRHSTDDLLSFLENHRPVCYPKTEMDLLPSYDIYGLAPWWTMTQAVCLLCGVATIDSETLRVLRGLNNRPLERTIRTLLGDHYSRKLGPNHYTQFSDYVAREFPLPLRHTFRLAHVFERLEQAIKANELKACSSASRSTEVLLDPVAVLGWASKVGIAVPEQLAVAVSSRDAIDYFAFPSRAFPDEVHFYGPFAVEQAKRNRLKPGNLSGVGAFEFITALPKSPPGDKSDDVLLPEFHELVEKEREPVEKVSAEEKPSLPPSPASLAKAEALALRRGALDKCLGEHCKNPVAREPLLFLYESLAGLPNCEFEKYTTRRRDKYFAIRFSCRAIGVFLRHIYPNMSLSKLYERDYMKAFGYQTSPLSLGTFRKWMNQEGIYDRKPSVKAI